MRYSESEETVLVGEFIPGSKVTIKILNLDTDELVGLEKDEVEESTKIPGIFRFKTEYIDKDTVPEYSNLLYIMESEDGYRYLGKFVYGGWLDNIEANVDIDLQPLEDKIDEHSTEIKDTLNIVNARIM